MNFDELLYREVKDGKEFDNLIPRTLCKSTSRGSGSTDLSMRLIKSTAIEHHEQMSGVAKVLQKDFADETILNIHDFLYWHFQYKADKSDQLLRSPACSWYQRFDGIDCKSYSIIASAILLNLGMKHYIRRIKQAGSAPSQWTHVYVVVPKDQKTGSLAKGHWTLDGTLPNTDEPHYIQKDDLFMEHFSLNGAAPGMNGISVSDITGIFGKVTCLGNHSFSSGDYKNAARETPLYFQAIIDRFNSAVASRNFTEASNQANQFVGMARAGVVGYIQKRSERKWSNCSVQHIDAMKAMMDFYDGVVAKTFNAYISNYFLTAPTGQSKTYDAHTGYHAIYFAGGGKATVPVMSMSFKPGVTVVPPFAITEYTASIKNSPQSFDLQSFLSQLQTVASTVGNIVGNPNNNNPGGVIQPGDYTQDFPAQNSTKTFGSGWIVGGILGAAAIAYMFSQAKDKPTKTGKRLMKNGK